MDQFADLPSSCRSCTFMVKCFGQPDEGPVVRPPLVRDDWLTYPIEIDGMASRVVSSGRTGTPIVLLHGPAGNADRWAFNFNAIARSGYRGFAVDLPGHGFAAKPRDFVPSLDAYARFVAGFLETLDEPAILVGASIGADIAVHTATLRPRQIEAIVLASGGQGRLGADAAEKLQRQLIYRSREGALERFRRCFYDTRLATRELIEQEYRLNTSPGGPEALRALAGYLAGDFNRDAGRASIDDVARQIPTLFIWGEEDHIVPPAIDPGPWQSTLMPRTGHMPNFERPGEFNKALLNFLDRTGLVSRLASVARVEALA